MPHDLCSIPQPDFIGLSKIARLANEQAVLDAAGTVGGHKGNWCVSNPQALVNDVFAVIPNPHFTILVEGQVFHQI